VKTIFTLCLIALAALLVLDTVVFFSQSYVRSANAQAAATVRVHNVSDALRAGSQGIQVSGRIVGFSCVRPEGMPTTHCYVATTD